MARRRGKGLTTPYGQLKKPDFKSNENGLKGEKGGGNGNSRGLGKTREWGFTERQITNRENKLGDANIKRSTVRVKMIAQRSGE